MSLGLRIAERLDAVARWLRRPSRRECRRRLALAAIAIQFPHQGSLIVDAMADGLTPAEAVANVAAAEVASLRAEIAAVRASADAMAGDYAAALGRLDRRCDLRQRWASDQFRAMCS